MHSVQYNSTQYKSVQFKQGYCWRAAYAEDSELYTAFFSDPITGSCTIYEINQEIFDRLEEGMDNSATNLLCQGRALYKYINDQYGPPFIIVFDENYKKLCPWAKVPAPEPEKTWPKEMTDGVVEALQSPSSHPTGTK